MSEVIDYRATFESQYGALKHTHPWFRSMECTVENSPWHREDNVLVHTDMVVDEYVTRANADHANGAWSHLTYLGAIACAFHDVGKPVARTAKFSEARGNYFSYPGHELAPARMFEDYAAARLPMFSPKDIFIIC